MLKREVYDDLRWVMARMGFIERQDAIQLAVFNNSGGGSWDKTILKFGIRREKVFNTVWYCKKDIERFNRNIRKGNR